MAVFRFLSDVARAFEGMARLMKVAMLMAIVYITAFGYANIVPRFFQIDEGARYTLASMTGLMWILSVLMLIATPRQRSAPRRWLTATVLPAYASVVCVVMAMQTAKFSYGSLTFIALLVLFSMPMVCAAFDLASSRHGDPLRA